MQAKKIILISGSFPPMRCGVGDYSARLFQLLQSRNVDIKVYTSHGAKESQAVVPCVSNWSVLSALRLWRKVINDRPDIVHIQYPTIGYGVGLGPQTLAVLLTISRKKVVTTIHEFSQAHLFRRISLLPFLVVSKLLIFTSDEELASASKALSWLGSLKKRSFVIPVGSNIPIVENSGKKPTCKLATFFGIFYPGRKIELVIDVFKRVMALNSGLKVRFIGCAHFRHMDYFEGIKQKVASTLPADRVEWMLDSTEKEVSRALSESNVCVLPYPDGVTFRRTTFLAAISHGVPVVTTRGEYTPEKLADSSAVLLSDMNGSEEETMVENVNRVLNDKALAKRLSDTGLKISAGFSWSLIADRHLEAYNSFKSS